MTDDSLAMRTHCRGPSTQTCGILLDPRPAERRGGRTPSIVSEYALLSSSGSAEFNTLGPSSSSFHRTTAPRCLSLNRLSERESSRAGSEASGERVSTPPSSRRGPNDHCRGPYGTTTNTEADFRISFRRGNVEADVQSANCDEDDAESFALEQSLPTYSSEPGEIEQVKEKLSRRDSASKDRYRSSMVSLDSIQERKQGMDMRLEDALNRFRSWEEVNSVSFSGRAHAVSHRRKVSSDESDDGRIRNFTRETPVPPSEHKPCDFDGSSSPTCQPIENLDIVEEQEKELLRLAIDRSKHETCASSVSSAHCLSVDSSIWNSSLAASSGFALPEGPSLAPPTSYHTPLKNQNTTTGGSYQTNSHNVMSASPRTEVGPEDFSKSEDEERRMLLVALERSLHEPKLRIN